MLGVLQRTLRGIEVSGETLAVDIIREVALGGPGHFLGHAETLARMETEYLDPAIVNRPSPDVWREGGAGNIHEGDRERVRRTLSSHHPQYTGVQADAAIRCRFPIRLTPQDMRPGNGRWAD